jgi:hypothetical protein
MVGPLDKSRTTPLEVNASGAIAQLIPRRELGQSVERKRVLVPMSCAAAAAVHRAAASWRLNPLLGDTAPARRYPVRECGTHVSSGSRSTSGTSAGHCGGLDELVEAARGPNRTVVGSSNGPSAAVFSPR